MRALFGSCCAGFSPLSFQLSIPLILERFGRRLPSSYGNYRKSRQEYAGIVKKNSLFLTKNDDDPG